jgi:small conductance mechanosensitive channel
MNKINSLNQIINNTSNNLLKILPSLILALIILIIGLIIIKIINKYSKQFIVKKAKDPLIGDFILSFISFILTVLLLVICLGVLGFDNFTNKILAGAGITTFVIGFALKDIGENFLAGILMAFQRPFKIGDLIQIVNIKGHVIQMSLRSTIIKTPDGKDVFIPNATILNNALENFTIDHLMRDEFFVNINFDKNAEKAIQIIEEVLNENKFILKIPAHSVNFDRVEKNILFIKITYWYKTDLTEITGSKIKSNTILKVFTTLEKNGFILPKDSII